jgi:hypothetical protein
MTDLVVVNRDTGEIDGNATEHLQELMDAAETDARTIQILTRQLAALRKQQSKDLTKHENYETAQRVLEHWKAACAPKTRELGGERLKKCLARLEAYDEDQLIQSIDGYVRFPYIIDGKRTAFGAKDQRYVDCELILRDAKHVDAGISMSEFVDSSVPAPAARPNLTVVPHDSGDLTELESAALKMASLGFHVFPCKPGEKVPATSHGFQDASTVPDEIGRWWRMRPFNIGVATGARSGIVVIDVDGEDGLTALRDLETRFSKLPSTLSVVTPRGGQHFYFKHPGVDIRNSASLVAEHIDVRGDGGYVLAPPSEVAGRRYELDDAVPMADLPAWFIKGLRAAQTAVATGPWAKRVAKLAEGKRNNELHAWTCHLLARGHEEAEVAMMVTDRNRSLADSLPERELHQLIGSALAWWQSQAS